MAQSTPAEFDPSRLPRGELGWIDFVAWAAASDDTIETRWLELKTDVDPTTKVGAAKVARFILAAANRDPTEAERRLNGHAVLLLGVGPFNREGLPPVENLTIRRLVDPFLGADGPRWDIMRVPGTSGVVLAIIVEPPKQGDQIFVARKNGDNIRDGQIYVRGDGASEPNTSAEFDGLVARSRPAVSAPEIEVSLLGELFAYTYDESVFNRLVEAIRSDYLRRLPAKEDLLAYPSSLAKVLATQARIEELTAFGALRKPESRTEEGFREEVEAYLDECRAQFPQLVDRVIGKVAIGTSNIFGRSKWFSTSKVTSRWSEMSTPTM